MFTRPSKQICSSSGTRRTFLGGAAAATAGTLVPGVVSTALAQSKPLTWKAVIQHRNGASYKKWLWLQAELPKRTGGRMSLEVTTIPELGLTGTEVLRVLKTGLIDVAEVLTGYVASDFPMIEATDLPGVATSYSQARKLYDTWAANVIAKHEDVMGGKVMATFCWGQMFIFTKAPLNSLADLKGKKIRNFAPAQARYLAAMGAEPISMTTSEVYSALQRGVIDGTITGPDQVKGMSIHEVTKHVSNINISPLGSYIVSSRRSWDKLPADLQKVLSDMSPELTDLGWKLGEENNQEGLALAREKGMTVDPAAKADWHSTLSKISAEQIVPWWAGRAGAAGRDAFNQYLAPIAGFKV
jgi:TRAP-type C4-dicarboxylate transport system substrate-binding protein